MTKIFVIYYSTYGHIAKLAQEIVTGAKKAGVEVELYQVAETLSEDILAKMHAPPKSDVPVIDPLKLPEADGILFGFPTRFGTMPAQVKALFDATGSLWAKGALAGKPAGFFFSTGSQNGGQETTALTSIPNLVHHGMVFVPLGYTTPLLFPNDEIRGGSSYGAGTIAGGDGSRQPSERELGIAQHQGEYFAKFVDALTKGRQQA